jgi:nucleotide-binding universal stress UspA family protein
MTNIYPEGPDGDALRRVEEDGSDMSASMTIDYWVRAPDEAVARQAADLVEAHGFDPSISQDEGTGAWSVYCSIAMLATHAGVVAAQARLNQLLQPLGATCDGWATFGNSSAPV